MRVFGICGKSKGGRSELVAELVARFRLDGLRVAVVKRAPLSFDLDMAGTDSYRQRESGCTQMLIASDRRLALMEEYPADSASPELGELLARLNPADMVLAINFRDAEIPRLEVCDGEANPDQAVRNPRWIVGKVARSPDRGNPASFSFDDHDAIAAFILRNAASWSESPRSTPMDYATRNV
jgi:molybdopterin-guanine dinucleotide biosynthesis adapter protein